MRSLSGLPGLVTLLVLSAGFASPCFGSGPITSGQVVSGAIPGPATSESWTFSGAVNDRILIAAITTSGGLNTYIRLIAPGSSEVVATSADRVDYKLTVGGSYTIIIQDDNLTDPGNYSLALLNVTAGPLTTGTDLDGGPLASAEVRSGQMNVIGDFDAFTFSGTTGDRVLVGALATGGASFNTTITLYPPGGGAAEDYTFTGDRLDHQLVATGTYTVVIEDYTDNHTGTYSVSLLNVTAGPLTSGPDPDGGTIASGEVKTGQGTSSPDFDAFKFTASAGGRVLIAAVTTSGALNTTIHLYPPNGTAAVVNTTADRVDYQLLVSGTYTIVVEDDNLTDGGNYNLSLLNVTAGPLTSGADPDGGPIASAEVRDGQMNVIGDFDAFTFSGTAGDRILVGALATGGVSFNTTMTLYPPGGGPGEDYSSTGDRLDHQLVATGIYTVVIEDYNTSHTGSYSVSLMNVTAGPLTSGSDPDGGTITSGDVKSGQGTSSPDFDAYKFTASAGNRVVIAAVTTSGAFNTTIHLYPPSGAAVVNTTADRVEYQIPTTGTYAIVVEDDNLTEAGNYNLSLLNVTAGPLTSGSDADGGALASAEVRSGQMNVVGDFDAFTFSGTAGDRVLVGALATAGVSYNTSITLYPPGGGPAEDYTTTQDRLDHPLLATGTYTVVIEDYGDTHTGNYTVTLLNLTAGPLTTGPDPDGGTIASGEVKSGQASSSPDFDAYRFTASVGNRVLIGAVTTSGALNTSIHLYPPNGAAVVNTTTDRVDYQVLTGGTYTVVIEDDNLTEAGNYNLSLLNVTAGPLTTGPDPDGGPLASAEVRSGQMNIIGDFDAFTFSGTAGDRVLVGALATAGVSFDTGITLYPPGGGPAEDFTYTADRMDHQLLATGTYTLVIEDYNDSHTGNYSVTLLNLTAGPLTSGPDPDGGTIASGEVKTAQASSSPDFDAYRFTGSAGNRVLIADVTTGGGLNTSIRVYPPSGPAVVNVTADRVDYQLPVGGTYTIVIEDDNLTETGTYNLSLLNVTAGPLTTGSDTDGGAIASAEVRNGQMNVIGDFDAFTFPGTAGDRILVGALATGGVSFNTGITLYPPGGGPAEDFTYNGDRLDHQLLVTGTYTAVIEDYTDSQTGSYTVTLLNLTAGPLTSGSDPDGGPISSGQVKAGQISTTPDFDAFRFTAYTGDTVTIGAVATSGTLNTTIYVYPPFGTSVIASSSDNVTYIPTAPGVHTIVIQDINLNQTGGYNLTFNLIRPPTSVSVDPVGFDPTRVVLRPAYPNPFQDGATLSFSLPRGLPVRLRVYDLTGALVRTLVDETLEAGPHDVRWDGRGERGARTASGVYYAELRAGSEVLRKKLVHIE